MIKKPNETKEKPYYDNFEQLKIINKYSDGNQL